jgi:hypothetical protein
MMAMVVVIASTATYVLRVCTYIAESGGREGEGRGRCEG